ncbi:amelogenin, X isoform-like isoform X2 [Stegodyphus dumicola]|uniref:amelogenin, X isoform-like isoform X2 n=1 Tax=Stegodyphus dumicola TaxID=202533 RepID=UPI0015AE6CFE|nr:amelogenin, X isoform-like isoform X2 [Stegodyphus dumicola]
MNLRRYLILSVEFNGAMWSSKFHSILPFLCFSILLLSPATALPLMTQKALEELLKMGIVGVLIGGAHHHLSKQKEQESTKQPAVSAQHHRPMLLPMPWHHPSVPQHPFMRAPPLLPPYLSHHHPPGHILPQVAPIHPQMMSMYQQPSPWISHWPKEQAYAGLMHQYPPHMGISSYSSLSNHPGQDLPGFSDLENIPPLRPWHPPPPPSSIIQRILELDK